MKRHMLMLCTLVFFTAARAEAITLPTMPLGSVPTELSPLDPAGVLSRVNVFVADREPYATFFVETAKVQGTMALAEYWTAEFGRALTVAAEHAGEAAAADPERWPEVIDKVNRSETKRPDDLAILRQHAERLELLVDPVVRASERLPGLAAQVPGLLGSLSGAYPGWRSKPAMLRAGNSIRHSSGQLKDAAVGLKRTLDNLRSIIAAVRK